jgi:hypothetical protein
MLVDEVRTLFGVGTHVRFTDDFDHRDNQVVKQGSTGIILSILPQVSIMMDNDISSEDNTAEVVYLPSFQLSDILESIQSNIE